MTTSFKAGQKDRGLKQTCFPQQLKQNAKLPQMFLLILPQARVQALNWTYTKAGSDTKYGTSILTTKHTLSFCRTAILHCPTIPGSQAEQRLVRETVSIFLISFLTNLEVGYKCLPVKGPPAPCTQGNSSQQLDISKFPSLKRSLATVVAAPRAGLKGRDITRLPY